MTQGSGGHEAKEVGEADLRRVRTTKNFGFYSAPSGEPSAGLHHE